MTKPQGTSDDEPPGHYASPACSMHEVDPGYMGLSDPQAPSTRAEIMAWRKRERARLIALRLAMPIAERTGHAASIARHLDALFPDLAGRVVSLYWPLRGEPDLRTWAHEIIARGGSCALPVVTVKQSPLAFHAWHPGAPLVRGIWDIPVPAEAREVVPDILLAPVIGFDRKAYRLGYGGGYFDRTLAAFASRPQVIGVGYAYASIPTIHPLDHDIGLDCVVTEQGCAVRRPD